MATPSSEKCKPWCDADFISDEDEHVCFSWLCSKEGFNLSVDDTPGQPTLILDGTAVDGEVRIPAGAAETVVAVLAATGHDDLAGLFRTALGYLSEDEKSAPVCPFGQQVADGEGNGWLSVSVAPNVGAGPALVGVHDYVVRSVREVETAVGPLS